MPTKRWPQLILILLCLWLLAKPAVAQEEQSGERTIDVLIPSVPSGANRQSILAVGADVVGLAGTLQAAIGQSFSTYLILSNGERVGLVGETPAVEARITLLRDQQTTASIKVWGTVLDPESDTRQSRIVVTGILADEQTPDGQSVTEIDLPTATIQFDLVNLRQGPGNRFPRGGQATRGQICVIINRNGVETWYFVDCPDDQIGWIDSRLVTVNGSTANVQVAERVLPAEPGGTETPGARLTPVPVSTPAPIPTTAPPFGYWRGQFFADRSLTGPVLFSFNSENLNFRWGPMSPHTSVPNDGFAARFERTYDFNYGYYRFEAIADDGVRVYVDDQLLIDDWQGTTDRGATVGRTLNGRHVVRVDYFEASGDADVSLTIDYLGNNLVWNATYYSGIGVAGQPVLQQREARGTSPIHYNWGVSSPLPGRITDDFWSASWVGTFAFSEGDYVFLANSDDGVRVYLNNALVIDDWRDGYREVRNRFEGVGAGEHTVRVEFYERSGIARLQVWWYRESNVQIPE